MDKRYVLLLAGLPFATTLLLAGLSLIPLNKPRLSETACNTAPPQAGTFTSQTISYADAQPPQAFVSSYGTAPAVSETTAVVVLPSHHGSRMPTVISIHGGGDYQGTADVFDAEMLAARGFAAVALNYRLVATADGGPVDGGDAGVPLENQFPASISDVRCGLRWVVANASTFGFDANRLAVVGSSAGAHLAALAASVPRDLDPRWDDGTCPLTSKVPAIKLVIGFYGIYDYMDGSAGEGGTAAQMLGAPVGTEPVSRQASPIAWVGTRTPSTLLIVGSLDTTIQPQQTLDYYATLQDGGLDSSLLELQTLGHGFPMFAADASGDLATSTCAALAALSTL